MTAVTPSEVLSSHDARIVGTALKPAAVARHAESRMVGYSEVVGCWQPPRLGGFEPQAGYFSNVNVYRTSFRSFWGGAIRCVSCGWLLARYSQIGYPRSGIGFCPEYFACLL